MPKAAAILRDNVYGWFERAERGVYSAHAQGELALAEVAERGTAANPEPSAGA
ncbi:MAG: DUF2161 family putative PD-(D/E)XK-type phosphodiesterase [Chloroflexota bacterium]